MTRAVLMETGDTKVDTWRYTEIQRPLSAALLPSPRMRQALCAMKLDEVWASLRSRNFHPGAVMGNRDEIYRPELVFYLFLLFLFIFCCRIPTNLRCRYCMEKTLSSVGWQ